MFKNIPPVVKNLLIINFIAYLAQLAFEAHGMDLINAFGLHFILASDFKVWQLFTYMFLHGGTMHLLLNMFSLWMFGCQAERDFGSQRFLLFYLACGIGAGVFQELWQLGEYVFLVKDYYVPAEVLNSWATVGASGAVYGVLLSFGMNHPDQKIWLMFPPIPFKTSPILAVCSSVGCSSSIGAVKAAKAVAAHKVGHVGNPKRPPLGSG